MKNLQLMLCLFPFSLSQMWHGFESNEYFVGRKPVVQSVATKMCQNMSATLVIVDSEDIMAFLIDLFDDLTGKIFMVFVYYYKHFKNLKLFTHIIALKSKVKNGSVYLNEILFAKFVDLGFTFTLATFFKIDLFTIKLNIKKT